MDRLLDELPRSRLVELLAFAELEPFGPLADARRAGTIASASYNTAFGRGRGAKVFGPDDLMSELRQPVTPQTGEQMATQLKGIVQVKGGPMLKRGERPPPEPKHGRPPKLPPQPRRKKGKKG